MKKYKIGIVGCGDISGIYLENITSVYKDTIEIAGVCDLIPERAQKAAVKYGLRIYKDMYELFYDAEVDIVLNLTRPSEHFGVSLPALKAGKHVYSEKPLGATLQEADTLLAAAAEKNLSIGGAPDTFLGAGLQTCRKLIDDGFIGKPLGAAAFMVCRGHEGWHPDPEFYYKHGGGPMLDMGPYYVTALMSLLGGVSSVTGMSGSSFPTRTIGSEQKRGTVISVDVPTYITGLMRFKSGAIASIFTTFDVYTAQVPRIEIYGSEGTLSVPDPNTFGGPVMLYRPEKGEFLEMPLMFGYERNSRGLGLMDMAAALSEGRAIRAGSQLTYHALEVMTSIIQSGESGSYIEIKSSLERPAPMGN